MSEARNIIIGTAGHVDHGKTQLIKALSGIDTDRLQEEKARGITIELGFAHIPNDQGYRIGVIDVPGHEKFIKNMLAGIGGIDFVLFVVAADEGIMPQTREHFEILQALGIDDGIIAVTKSDMVDEEWLELLLEEVREYFRGSFLDGKPLLTVSSKTGDGIEALRQAILDKCDREVKRREDPELFRLPIDRVFTMQGFGTVVTGTLMEGSVSVNEERVLYPEGRTVKLRGIQTYGSDVETAVAGQRTAINLGGIKKEELRRGDVLAARGAVTVSTMLDVRLSVFESSERQVLQGSRVHLYTGSAETLAKVVLLDRELLAPGEAAYAQLRLEQPIALRRGDRFIIRFYSPIVTIGGGRVLDAMPDKHKRHRPEVLDLLTVLASDDLLEIIVCKTNGYHRYHERELAEQLGLLPAEMRELIERGENEGRLRRLDDGTLLAEERWVQMEAELREILRSYHEAHPLEDGISRQELQSRLQQRWHIEDSRSVIAALTAFLDCGTIQDKGRTVALAGFRVAFTAEQQQLRGQLAERYREAHLEMLRTEDVVAGAGAERSVVVALLADLAEAGVLVKVDPAYYVIAEGWQEAVQAAASAGAGQDGFTLAEYRDQLGSSRKYASLLLQAFDRAGITVFDGERRRMAGQL